MSVENHRVLIGACGWKHAVWVKNFYTEDLPEDWQLGFYSNEFAVVYVYASDWLATSQSSDFDISEWKDDVSDSFSFILEISNDVLLDERKFTEALNKANSLDELCLGFVFKLSPKANEDIALFKNILSKAQAISPVCIDAGNTILSTELKHLLMKENVAGLKSGKSPNLDSLNKGALEIYRISSDGLDMKDVRKVVEVCLDVSSDDCISVLCFEGEPPSLEVMRNADIILNLL